MKTPFSNKKFNYYDDKVFWDYDSEWSDENCQYPDCGMPAIGRVKSQKTIEHYPPMGYMLVCEKHLNEFIDKYEGKTNPSRFISEADTLEAVAKKVVEL